MGNPLSGQFFSFGELHGFNTKLLNHNLNERFNLSQSQGRGGGLAYLSHNCTNKRVEVLLWKNHGTSINLVLVVDRFAFFGYSHIIDN